MPEQFEWTESIEWTQVYVPGHYFEGTGGFANFIKHTARMKHGILSIFDGSGAVLEACLYMRRDDGALRLSYEGALDTVAETKTKLEAEYALFVAFAQYMVEEDTEDAPPAAPPAT